VSGWPAAVLCAVVLTGCAFGTSTATLPPRMNLAGFAFDVPRAPGWRAASEHTRAMEALRFVREVAPAEERTHQLEVQAFVPVEAVDSEAAVVRWAAARTGVRHAEPASGHGAVCARYTHRWEQRLAFDGREAPAVTHALQDRGLFCIHPADDGRLVHLRATERVAAGYALGHFDAMAEDLLQSVRWEGGPSTPFR